MQELEVKVEAAFVADQIAQVAERLDALVELGMESETTPAGVFGILDDLARRLDTLRVVHRPVQSGLGTAIVRGLKEAIDG